VKPHRNRYWLFPKIDDLDVWNTQVLEVCGTYRTAIELYLSQGVHTVSIDEQTGIQALERIAADLLPQSGLVARREYEYVRHGTLGLFGNLHVATGQILSPLIRHRRGLSGKHRAVGSNRPRRRVAFRHRQLEHSH
jgi:hypothetical protein